MMQQALGWLRWTPSEFWGATLAELQSAVTGYLETRGVTPRGAKADLYDELLEIGREAVRQERQQQQEASA